MPQPRFYRAWINSPDLVSFRVAVKETDLQISACRSLVRKAQRLINKYREPLEAYIAEHPEFATSLSPYAVEADSPRIVRLMASAGIAAGVGPMASVAGAIAELVGDELQLFSPDLIIENGGDIFLKTTCQRVICIYAGNSPLSGQVGLVMEPGDTPCGVCTSSGTVGHSLSFGRADAVTIVARSAAVADAAATAAANRVNTAEDIAAALELALNIEGTSGVVIIKGDKMGAKGRVNLCRLEKSSG